MPPRVAPALAAAGLGALALLLHGDALHGFWRWDDGGHLRFTVQHAPWEYFFIPEVTRAQSGANVTPWNPFFYEINLALFGWRPTWFYAHQLVLLWGAAFATYMLIEPWRGRAAAFLGAALFLAGQSTHQVAHQLMTGHYATGLLFMVLALIFYCRALSRDGARLAWIGAGFYLLATTCKEVYVPLVALLPFLPLADLRRRARAIVPYILVACAYIGWRYAVLERLVGGYPGAKPALAEITRQFIGIPALLFGTGLPLYLALGALILLLAWGLIRRRLPILPFLVGAVLLLGPLLALVGFPGIHAADRYLFLPWWGVSVLVAMSVRGAGRLAPLIWLPAMLLAGVALYAGWQARPAFAEGAHMQDRLYRHALELPANVTLLPPESRSYMKYQLDAVMQAYDGDHGGARPRPVIAANLHAACAGLGNGTRIDEYDLACGCFRDVSGTLPKLAHAQLDALNARLAPMRLRSAELSLSLGFSDGLIRWHLGPYPEGTYEFVNGITGDLIAAVAADGFYPWAAGEKFRLFLRYTSPQGWVAISPIMDFDPATMPLITWRGPGLDAWPAELFDTLRRCAAPPGR